MEQLLAELRRLQERIQVVENTPRLHRKDVQRLLGVSARTLDRRMKDPHFPRPIYDAGRPKWPASAFNGHQNGQSVSC